MFPVARRGWLSFSLRLLGLFDQFKERCHLGSRPGRTKLLHRVSRHMLPQKLIHVERLPPARENARTQPVAFLLATVPECHFVPQLGATSAAAVFTVDHRTVPVPERTPRGWRTGRSPGGLCVCLTRSLQVTALGSPGCARGPHRSGPAAARSRRACRSGRRHSLSDPSDRARTSSSG